MHRELCNLVGLPQGLGDFEATRVSGFMAKAVTWGKIDCGYSYSWLLCYACDYAAG